MEDLQIATEELQVMTEKLQVMTEELQVIAEAIPYIAFLCLVVWVILLSSPIITILRLGKISVDLHKLNDLLSEKMPYILFHLKKAEDSISRQNSINKPEKLP